MSETMHGGMGHGESTSSGVTPGEAMYEGMFILDQGKYSRDAAGLTQQVADLITQFGGSLLAARLWDERKLAYPIKGQKKGVYWLTYFRMPGGGVTGLERQLAITEGVLRTLVLKVDERIADALVQHALSGDAPRRHEAAGRAEPGAAPRTSRPAS
jgi:small subunit ribosomal protein S6